MFYNLDFEQIISVLGVHKKIAKQFLKKGKHQICELYLKKNPGDIDGAINRLKEYLEKRKQNSNYQVEKYLKSGLTEEEALQKITELKRKTSGQLESYIARFGEIEGAKKYEEFCKKSAITPEKYKEKHGPEWESYWKEYNKQKDSRQDSFFQKKYGDDWQQERNEFIDSWTYQMSLEGMVEKYGKEKGEKKFNQMNSDKANQIENFVRLYGENEGIRRFTEANSKRGFATTIDYFIEKYGLKEGISRYEEKSRKLQTSLESLIEKYGLEEGQKKYHEMCASRKGRYTLDWYKQKYGEELGKEKFKLHYAKSQNAIKQIQKQSIRFFEYLQLVLNITLSFGQNKSEKMLVKECGKRYFYDAVDEENRIIFEFNGSAFHFHEQFSDDWVSAYGNMQKEQSLEKDTDKKNLAIQMGYRYCVIWDFDIKTKIGLQKTVELIKEEFYARSNT